DSAENFGISSKKMEFSQQYYIEDESCTIKKVFVKNTRGNKESSEVYTLVPRDCTGILSADINAIPYPVENVICMSSSHVAFLTKLGMESKISGISGTRFISNKKVTELIDDKKIVDIGSEELPNYELIISLKPDVIFAYRVNGNSNSYIETLQKYGIKVLTIGEHLEEEPLGKVEYIKLFGLLCNRKMEADSIFSSIKEEYIKTKQDIAEHTGNTSKAKVLINIPYKGVWMIPGGNNYISRIIQDAGGCILGAKEGISHSSQMSFEEIYNIALQADVWIHTNMINKLDDLGRENPLYKNIPSFKRGEVYNNTAIVTPNGGSDYWETGTIEPHIILKDLAKILHPDLMKDNHTLKYYLKLD
ncbi:MAG: ABC transporter substrate-binding protein, partial [Bacteroidales bacterium]|nr:ABC transporter substrate-binding protein [Bacteroidales bacterium]